MSLRLWAIPILLFVALTAGTISDEPPTSAPLMIGGYRVLAGDFHVHSAVFSAGALAPWDLVLEARRQGLDVFAITPHNQVFTAKLGRWCARWLGGARVIAGEEIRGPAYHLIALGIQRSVSWRLSAAKAIDEIHQQGGVAIAAHPLASFWPAYDAEAMGKLDGSEVLHPAAYLRPQAADELQRFYARRPLTAVGSSDYHGLGRLGLCRTYVFATDDSEAAILAALRAGRTVVYEREGHAYGDPELIRLAAQHGRLRERESGASDGGPLAVLSRISGLLALLGMLLFGFPAPARSR